MSPNNLAIVFAPCTSRKYSETSPKTECVEVILISYETLRGITSLTTHASLADSSARAEEMWFSVHARKAIGHKAALCNNPFTSSRLASSPGHTQFFNVVRFEIRGHHMVRFVQHEHMHESQQLGHSLCSLYLEEIL